MQKNAFRITFRGEVKPGWDRAAVKSNMARLFKLDLNDQQHRQKINRLFSGRSVVIKDGINKQLALAYTDAIAKVGAKAYIKLKIGAPDGIEERRFNLRRKLGNRRSTPRLSAILPDRRINKGRRDNDTRE